MGEKLAFEISIPSDIFHIQVLSNNIILLFLCISLVITEIIKYENILIVLTTLWRCLYRTKKELNMSVKQGMEVSACLYMCVFYLRAFGLLVASSSRLFKVNPWIQQSPTSQCIGIPCLKLQHVLNKCFALFCF